MAALRVASRRWLVERRFCLGHVRFLYRYVGNRGIARARRPDLVWTSLLGRVTITTPNGSTRVPQGAWDSLTLCRCCAGNSGGGNGKWLWLGVLGVGCADGEVEHFLICMFHCFAGMDGKGYHGEKPVAVGGSGEGWWPAVRREASQPRSTYSYYIQYRLLRASGDGCSWTAAHGVHGEQLSRWSGMYIVCTHYLAIESSMPSVRRASRRVY